MDDIGLYDCPMPESFREKIGIASFLTLLFYLGFVSRVIFGPLMPEIQQDLGLSNAETGKLFFFITIGYLLGPLCSGLISSRVNHLGTLKISAWLLGLALVPFLFVDSFNQMAATLIVIGFAGALHLPSAIATITAEIQKSDWGKGLSLHQCAPPLAFVSAPLFAALMLNWYSWRIVLASWAVLSLLSALFFTIWGRGGEFPGRVISRINIKKAIGIRSFWIMALLMSMGMAGNAGIFAMLPLFFVNERGFGLEMTNTIIGLSQISGFVAVFFAGMLVDRLGQRVFMSIALGCAALLTVGIGFVKGWMLIAVLFIQPAVLTAFFPAAFGALARVAHPSLRSVTSAVGPPLSFLIGAGAIPVVIGHLAESISFGAGIVVTGIFMMSGLPMILLLRLGQFDGEAGC